MHLVLLLVPIHTRVRVSGQENSAKCIPRKGAESFFMIIWEPEYSRDKFLTKALRPKIFVTKFLKEE